MEMSSIKKGFTHGLTYVAIAAAIAGRNPDLLGQAVIKGFRAGARDVVNHSSALKEAASKHPVGEALSEIA